MLNFQGDDRIRMPVGCQHLYIWQGTGQIILICLGNHTLPFHFQALKEHFENIFNICMTHSSFVYIYIYIYDECKLIPTQRLSAIPTQRFWETQEGIKGLKYEILLEYCIYDICHIFLSQGLQNQPDLTQIGTLCYWTDGFPDGCKGKGICFKTVPFCCCVATCFITEYDDWMGECWSATGFDFRWMFFQYINNFLKIRLILWDCTCCARGQRSLNMSRFTSILQF